MNRKRLTLSIFVLLLFALAWNGFIHLVVLREANEVLAEVGRPAAERSMVLSLLLAAGVVSLFVVSYARTVRQGTLGEGMRHGLWFGLLAGLLVDVNQYVVYPIPARLAAAWFVAGLAEFVLYGVLVSRLYPPPRGVRQEAEAAPRRDLVES